MEENRTAPSREQIEIMKSDWMRDLKRDERFIHRNVKGAIERKLAPGENFSDYFLGNTDPNAPQQDQLRKARQIAQTVINGLTAENIQVSLGGMESFTNGKSITVASDYFDRDDLSQGRKTDLLVGFSVHEAAHIIHSDFERMEKSLQEIPSDTERRIKMNINNILEDERIEYLIGEDMPGMADYLGCVKEYSYDKLYNELKEKGCIPTEAIPRFINTFIAAIRYPASLAEQDIVDHYEELKKVRKILTPFPLTSSEVFQKTDQIYDVMKDIIRKQLEEQKKKEQQAQSHAGNSQQNGNDKDDSSQNEEKPQDEDSDQSDEQPDSDATGDNDSDENEEKDDPNGQGSGGTSDDESDEDQDGPGGDGQQDDGPSDEEILQELEKALSSEQCEDLLQAIEENIETPNEGCASSVEYADEAQSQYINGICDREGAGGFGETFYMKRVRGDQAAYLDSLKRVRQFVPAMTKALKCRTEEFDYELHGEKAGKLNTNKLASLRSGNDRIFIKRGEVTADSACVCILIDESGSMFSQSRYVSARDAAVLVNEAVKGIPNLEVFIYGYTDGEMSVYAERNNANRFALGEVGYKGGTPTGAAMRAATERIRRMTSNQCLMLVVTDGQPNSVEDTQRADEEARKKGFIPVGIWIGRGYCDDSIKESVQLTDLRTLAPQIGSIVRKKLLRAIQRHDSN